MRCKALMELMVREVILLVLALLSLSSEQPGSRCAAVGRFADDGAGPSEISHSKLRLCRINPPPSVTIFNLNNGCGC